MAFSELYSSIQESATLAITKKVRELVAQGRDVVGLTLGEPDFDTPEYIKVAADKAMKDNFTHYPPVAGIPDLRQAVCDKFARENGLHYKPANIVVSTGAKQSVYNICNALVNPGDDVLIPAPFWVSYRDILNIAGAKIREVECTIEENYKITPEKLRANLRPDTKLIIIASPSNPTGSMYSREDWSALVPVLQEFPNTYIVLDEIYEHIAFERKHVSLATFPEVFERCIVINGFSKGYAMTGWRLGYLATANTELAYLCEKIQGQITSGANSIAQKAGVAALSGGIETVEAMCQAFRERRDRMYAQLSQIQGLKVNLPDGAFYFYPDASAFIGKKTPEGQVITDIEVLCLYLIECGVALIPGTAFGTNSHFRISYAYAQEVLDKGVERLAAGLGKLQ